MEKIKISQIWDYAELKKIKNKQLWPSFQIREPKKMGTGERCT